MEHGRPGIGNSLQLFASETAAQRHLRRHKMKNFGMGPCDDLKSQEIRGESVVVWCEKGSEKAANWKGKRWQMVWKFESKVWRNLTR